MKTTKKGFTLLELLIVIAILAILASAAVVVLNPAELLRRARDSGRITNIANIRNAINLYLTTVTTIDLDVQAGCMDTTPTSKTFTSLLTGYSGTLATTTISTSAYLATTTATAVARGTAGYGWIPINFALTAGGSPLSALPLDPNNNTTGCSGSVGCFYYYLCSSNSSSTYEIGANMESSAYANGGDSDVESTDGGNSSTWYEAGNDPGLDL